MRVDTTLYGSTRHRRMSANGNPKYDLHTADGNWTTGTDSAINYEVPNLTGDKPTGCNIPVTIIATERGRVTDVIKR